ncbi:hypothetical protein CRENBAI_021474 [Crenichthys baileyi]|uniref:Uncharacterized protein n=1 Tax=Crenichthys baileyi TaxID=28760 RepID=A0AAV9R781_9TELE
MRLLDLITIGSENLWASRNSSFDPVTTGLPSWAFSWDQAASGSFSGAVKLPPATFQSPFRVLLLFYVAYLRPSSASSRDPAAFRPTSSLGTFEVERTEGVLEVGEVVISVDDPTFAERKHGNLGDNNTDDNRGHNRRPDNEGTENRNLNTENNSTATRRARSLQALAWYLKDDPKKPRKQARTLVEPRESWSSVIYGIKYPDADVDQSPEDVDIIVEGVEMLHELNDVATAWAVLFGII